MNFVLLLFFLLTSFSILSVSLLNLFESKLPIFFIKLIRYGKFSHQGKMVGLTSKIVREVPKSWFRHFYCGGVLVFSLMFYLTTRTYIFSSNCPEWLQSFLNTVCGTKRIAYSK